MYGLFSDDGTFYFDEKIVGAHEHQGSLSTTASVVRGLTAFAAVISEKLNVCEVLGLLFYFFMTLSIRIFF